MDEKIGAGDPSFARFGGVNNSLLGAVLAGEGDRTGGSVAFGIVLGPGGSGAGSSDTSGLTSTGLFFVSMNPGDGGASATASAW